jgi:hypothetical protein
MSCVSQALRVSLPSGYAGWHTDMVDCVHLSSKPGHHTSGGHIPSVSSLNLGSSMIVCLSDAFWTPAEGGL